MTYKTILLITNLIIFNSCSTKQINSPLATVIKLNSAESLSDLEEAKKYQDINKVYGEYGKHDSVTSEKLWHELVNFNASITNDKKFTNQFKYYNYDIQEIISGKKAEVVFKAKDTAANIRSISYKLELIRNSWIVENIEYKKRD